MYVYISSVTKNSNEFNNMKRGQYTCALLVGMQNGSITAEEPLYHLLQRRKSSYTEVVV